VAREEGLLVRRNLLPLPNSCLPPCCVCGGGGGVGGGEEPECVGGKRARVWRVVMVGEGWRGAARHGEGWRGMERGGEAWRGVMRGGEGWRGVARDVERSIGPAADSDVLACVERCGEA